MVGNDMYWASLGTSRNGSFHNYGDPNINPNSIILHPKALARYYGDPPEKVHLIMGNSPKTVRELD